MIARRAHCWILPALLCVAVITASPLRAAPRMTSADAARAYFTDTPLIDQHGVEHRFYSDLLAGKVVIISAFYTACQGVCPVMVGRLKQVQDYLGDRLGKNAVIITLTLDPEADTPQALERFSKKLGAKKGWYFLTGPRPELEQVLKKLGQYVEDKEQHSSILILGNEPTGLWKKVFAMASIDDLRTAVDSVLHDDGSDAGP